MKIVDEILKSRGLTGAAKTAFLQPAYESSHDPFLLPDMEAAVARLVTARDKQQHITIYGDYDIDGLTATTVLVDAFASFGFKHVEVFIPNRFVEGYGMTVEAVERIAEAGAELIVTVDCGSLSTKEIERAGELGVDVIVTDHHNVQKVQPPAVAVINPKRLLQDCPEMYEDYILKNFEPSLSEVVVLSQDNSATTSLSSAELATLKQSSTSKEVATKLSGLDKSSSKLGSKSLPASSLYPFLDLPGVGVAFKLVQALQTRLEGLPQGQEKWLLDLVALGTVCDVVTLRDENRMHVFWGLKVLSQTRRVGLKALMAVAGVEPDAVNARSLGFGLGPRMNAAGRLETAQYALDMLLADDGMSALEKAQKLDDMNRERRAEQDKIFKQAIVEAEQRIDDPVLVVSGKDWNHGIIGIVAAKLLEKYHKPTYVLQEDVNVAEHYERSARASGGGDETSNSFRSESEGQTPPELISKGSARSYGDFSAADAIRAADDIITKGGGHKLAAGVTMPTANIAAFRERVNRFYHQQKLNHEKQEQLLLPRADADAELSDLTEELVAELSRLEPFGSGNPQPVLRTENLIVKNVRRMGSDGQHVKLTLEQASPTSTTPTTTTTDNSAIRYNPRAIGEVDFLAFNAPEHFFVELGQVVTALYHPDINEWRGRRSVEGRLLHLEIIN